MNYHELFDLTDRVILQLGFTGPIGRQFSSILAESGCRLILGDINEKDAIPIVENLKKINKRTEYIKIDVTREEDVESTIREIEKKYDVPTVLVNTFSRRPTDFNKKFEESDYTSWKDVLETNISAMYLVCRAVSRFMQKKGEGSIINVASFLGVVAPDQRVYGKSGLNSPAAYTASKHGVIGLTKYLASYLGQYHIRVNSISPGGVDSGGLDEEFVRNYSHRVPLGRMANGDDLKGPLIFLASQASQYVTGHNLIVDGGFSIW